MKYARMKPCQITQWRFGRWRPVERIRTLVHDDGKGPSKNPNEIKASQEAGNPGEKIVQYADKGRWFGEHWYDFIWNVELDESELEPIEPFGLILPKFIDFQI